MELHRLISSLESSGVRFVVTGAHLDVKGNRDALTADVRQAIADNIPDVIGILKGRSQAPPNARTVEPDPVPGRGAARTARSTAHGNADEFGVWGADADVLTWFSQWQDRPTAPFQLDQGRRVVDVAKFFQQLRRDVAAGPRGPRARNGALQDDIRIIFQRFGTN